MPIAQWNGSVIAQTDVFETVEGNTYFPRDSLHPGYFEESSHTTVCPWKGTAHYLNVVVDGKVNQNAAWFYPQPKQAAANITNYVAFWKGVEVKK